MLTKSCTYYNHTETVNPQFLFAGGQETSGIDATKSFEENISTGKSKKQEKQQRAIQPKAMRDAETLWRNKAALATPTVSTDIGV